MKMLRSFTRLANRLGSIGQVWAWVCSKSLINLISMLRYCSQSEPTSWLVPLT
jgi:hypothetical protein